jgi:hypothetical protein
MSGLLISGSIGVAVGVSLIAAGCVVMSSALIVVGAVVTSVALGVLGSWRSPGDIPNRGYYNPQFARAPGYFPRAAVPVRSYPGRGFALGPVRLQQQPVYQIPGADARRR